MRYLLIALTTAASLLASTTAFTPVVPSVCKGVPHLFVGPFRHVTKSQSSSSSRTFATIPAKDESIDITSDKSTVESFNAEQRMILGSAIPYEKLTIGVLKETYPGENRVSQSPDSVQTLVKAGMTVVVQAGGKWCSSLMLS